MSSGRLLWMTNKQQRSERTSKPKVEIKEAQSSNKADGNCDTSARLLGAKIPPRDAQRTPGNENRLNPTRFPGICWTSSLKVLFALKQLPEAARMFLSSRRLLRFAWRRFYWSLCQSLLGPIKSNLICSITERVHLCLCAAVSWGSVPECTTRMRSSSSFYNKSRSAGLFLQIPAVWTLVGCSLLPAPR